MIDIFRLCSPLQHLLTSRAEIEVARPSGRGLYIYGVPIADDKPYFEIAITSADLEV